MPPIDRDLSYTQDRELSWLQFNQRVLEEAADETVPLMERLRFLSIFTSNLDEFFMVRVGSLLDLNVLDPETRDNKGGRTPGQQLAAIYAAVGPLIRRRDGIYAQVSRALAERGVEDVPYEALRGAEREYIRGYYRENIRPLLSPQIIDPSHPFPHLKNKALYAAALLRDGERLLLGIVGVPETAPAVLELPARPGAFVRTETVLSHYLRKIFKIYAVEEQAVAAVTRNADISFDERFDEEDLDLRSHMARLLRQRDRLAPVRLEMQGEAPRLLEQLLRRLKLEAAQSYVSTCPLSLGYAYQLTADPALFYPPHAPQWPSYLRRETPMWDQVRQRDVLLFYPYHAMQPFLDLLKEAAADPKVLSIQITVYRLARKSAVVKHLCAAAENGKAVTVLVELRARFDEQNNITWARELEEAGCRILYGPTGYKCHAKLCLLTRREKGGLSYITQVGTGNYNEKTAGLYTDFCLMSASPALAADAVAFFQNMLIGDLRGSYQKLLVAPVSLKQTLLRLIDGEIARGERGRILIKANSVTERDLIDKLSQASRAGVRVDLIVRGICCLVPGIPGKTDHITVTSLVGRFLEHSRIYCFGEGALRQVYLSSADIMTRNQERRVEVACPVESRELKDFLWAYLERILADNVKARRLLPDGSYVPVGGGAPPLSAQQYDLEHPPRLAPSEEKRPAGWLRRLLGRG
ncbi:polyphosphate kinase 1 [uncultured Oscillibacter sp.]|uniref:polyphosphate kinase 1 n=1 Tax=uncultured Oscillibacter sp. TaxID=876091 RepID=UPI0025E4451E|nr:polyphosphate kinase 1 [uncultured Oscillibacter sp.]